MAEGVKTVEASGWSEVEALAESLASAECVKVSGINDEQCLGLVGKVMMSGALRRLDLSANRDLESLTILKAIEMVVQTRRHIGLAPVDLDFATFDLQSILDEARRGLPPPASGGEGQEQEAAWMVAPLTILTDYLRENRSSLATNEAALRLELVMRLRLEIQLERFKRENPRVLEIPIQKPIFIVGLFRSGTSLLFNLLSRDKNVRAPRLWELWSPRQSFSSSFSSSLMSPDQTESPGQSLPQDKKRTKRTKGLRSHRPRSITSSTPLSRALKRFTL